MHRRITDYRKFLAKEDRATENANLATINSLAYAIDARDPYTRGHSERVATYAIYLAKHLKLSRSRIQLLRQCCRLHDVGKIGVPDQILLKPGKLTMEERAQIELHPVYGAEILGELKFMSKGLPVILQHHERHDGMGYPYGVKNDKLSLEVKIIHIVDAFDAMSSDRPYRKALPMADIIREFRANAGKQFDPKLTAVFLKMLEASNHENPSPANAGKMKNGIPK